MPTFLPFNEMEPWLRQALQMPLPGLQQQLAMAPPYRDVPSEAWVRQQNPRLAAVLVLLCANEWGWQLVFTKRRAYAGVHSAQVSFPGGKLEEQDADLLAAALRETEEEVGVPTSLVQVVGALTPLYIPPSNFLVHPYVGILPERVTWQPDETEVDVLLEIPLDYLHSPDARALRIIQVGAGEREVPGFVWQEHFIWGATAMMLEEFLSITARMNEELKTKS